MAQASSRVSAARWQAEIHFDAEGRQALGPIGEASSRDHIGNGTWSALNIGEVMKSLRVEWRGNQDEAGSRDDMTIALSLGRSKPFLRAPTELFGKLGDIPEGTL
jgi:hypothetical protein